MKATITSTKWREIKRAAKTTNPENIVWMLRQYYRMADTLQACIQRHNLGEAGCNVADIAVQEIDRQRARKGKR